MATVEEAHEDAAAVHGPLVHLAEWGPIGKRLAGLDLPLLVLALISFVASVGIGVVVPLIPLFAQSLGAEPAQLGLLVGGFAALNSVGQLGVGLLIDRVGTRPFVRGGLGLYGAGNALSASVADTTSLVLYRSVAGLGAGADIVSTRLYLAQVTDPSRLAYANGVLSAAASAGQVIGPALGGVVSAAFGLRAPFIVVGVTSLLALAASVLLPSPHITAGEPASDEAPHPLDWREIGSLAAAQALQFAGFGVFITTYATFADQQLSWSPLEVGLGFSAFGLGSIVLGPPLSRLADRVGRRRVAMVALLPTALFIAVLAFGLPRPILYLAAIIGGGGLTAYQGAWFALLTGTSSGKGRGRVVGTVSAVAAFGTVVGSQVAAFIWQAVSLQAALLSGAVLFAIAGAAVFFVPREVDDVGPDEHETVRHGT